MFVASYRQYVHEAHGLLAPVRGDRGAHRALDRLLDRIGIAPPRLRKLLDGVDNRLEGEVEERVPENAGFGNADQLDLGVADERPGIVEGGRDRDDTDEAEPPPVGDGARLAVDDHPAVLVEAPLRHLV